MAVAYGTSNSGGRCSEKGFTGRSIDEMYIAGASPESENISSKLATNTWKFLKFHKVTKTFGIF